MRRSLSFLTERLQLQTKEGSRSSFVLYIGLGVCSIGLIIFLVGVGEKGFKSLELQLIGPSLIGKLSWGWVAVSCTAL